jgi:AAA15 family ATPase/GTPase
MAFTSLNIQNFRGIKSLEMSDFGQVNVLVGKNNSGKTSVLEAAWIALTPSFVEISNTLLRGQRSEGDSYLLFHNALSHQKSIITVKTTTEKSKQIELSLLDEDDLYDEKIVLKVGERRIDDIMEQPDKELIHCVVKETSPLFADFFTGSHQEEFIFNLADKYIPARQFDVASNRVLTARRYDSTLKKKLSPLIVEKSIQDIVTVLSQIDDKIIGIQLGLNDIILFDIGLARLVPLHVMGDGMRQMLSILATIAISKNEIIFIDEIDNGLHYSTLTTLWNAILKAAKEFNVQIFATTHSYECLAALAQVQEGSLFGEDSVRVFRLEREGENHKAVKMTGEDIAVMVESNWEMR